MLVETFVILVTTAHIIAAGLEVLKIKSTKEVSEEVVITDPENKWMQTSEERKATLKDICLKIIDDFSFATEDSSMTRCFNMQSRF